MLAGEFWPEMSSSLRHRRRLRVYMHCTECIKWDCRSGLWGWRSPIVTEVAEPPGFLGAHLYSTGACRDNLNLGKVSHKSGRVFLCVPS